MQQLLDIHRLVIVQPGNLVLVEKQVRQRSPVSLPSRRQRIGVHAAGNALLDQRHRVDGVAVTAVDHVLHLAEIERRHILESVFDQNVAVRRQFVVGMHHRQRQDLVHHVVLAGLGIAGRALASDQHLRTEILFQHLPWEIIVHAAVVEQRRILFQRFENERNGHRSPDRLTQVSVAVHHLLLRGRIGRHATKRDEKLIEIASALRVRRCEELHERHVDLVGRDQIGGQLGHHLFVAVTQIEPQRHHRRIGLFLPEIIDILRLDLAAHPVFDLIRFENFGHFVGRVPDRVKPRDNRSHRRARNVVDRNPVLFQSLHYSDVVQSLSPAAAHHHTHFLR